MSSITIGGVTMEKQTFRYQESDHSYWLGDMRIPGCTEILKGLGIIDTRWADERDLIRGQAVHLGCRYLAEGCLDGGSVDISIKGYLEAYQKFLNLGLYHPKINEVPMCHPLLSYGVTPDSVGVWNGHRFPAIVELKSGTMPIFAALQTAAQAQAVAFKEGISWLKIKRVGVQLNADGTYKEYEFSDPNDAGIFNAALSVYIYKINIRLK